MLYLKEGVKGVFVRGHEGVTGNIDLVKTYPLLTGRTINNDFKVRTKNDKIFGYPLKK